MNKRKILLACTAFFVSAAVSFAQDAPWGGQPEGVPWKEQVEKLAARLKAGDLGQDFELSFSGYRLGYTIKGQGTAVIRYSLHPGILGDFVDDNIQAKMAGPGRQEEKSLTIGPARIKELCDLLIRMDFASLENDTGMVYDAPSNGVSLSLDGAQSRRWWWDISERPAANMRVGELLKGFGEYLADAAGLRAAGEPIVPVCTGISAMEQLDTDKDGSIDWIKIKLGFYSFAPASFTCELLGNYVPVSFKPGVIEQDFWLNAYLLRQLEQPEQWWVAFHGPGSPVYRVTSSLGTFFAFTPPFTLDKQKLKQTPDVLLKGKGLIGEGKAYLEFKAKAGQSVILNAAKGNEKSEDWMIIEQVSDNKVKLGGQDREMTVSERKNSWGLAPEIRLVRTEGDIAVFEAGYNPAGRFIEHRKEMIQLLKKQISEAQGDRKKRLEQELAWEEARVKTLIDEQSPDMAVEIGVTSSSPL